MSTTTTTTTQAPWKDFELIEETATPPWGHIDNQLQKDIIDTMLGSCALPVKDTVGGHKHFLFYDHSGVAVLEGIDGDTTVKNNLVVNGNIVNPTIFGSITVSGFVGTAGIVHSDAYGVLSSSAIVDADIDNSASISWSKINNNEVIVNNNISTSADIAWSKIHTFGSIVNNDISLYALIDWNKINKLGASPYDMGACGMTSGTDVQKADGSGGLIPCIALEDITYIHEISETDLDAPFGDPGTTAGFCQRTAEGHYQISPSSVTAHPMLSTTHTDAHTQTVTRGSLITGQYDGVGVSGINWNLLTKGAPGTILTCNTDDVIWDTPSNIGIQVYSENLTAIAELTFTTNRVILLTGSGSCTTGPITNAYISNTALISLSKLAVMNQNTYIGNVAASGNTPIALTSSQMKSSLGYYTSGDSANLSGLTVTRLTSSHATININSSSSGGTFSIIGFQNDGITAWNMSSESQTESYSFILRSRKTTGVAYWDVNAFVVLRTSALQKIGFGLNGGTNPVTSTTNSFHFSGDTIRLDTPRSIFTSGYVGEICWNAGGISVCTNESPLTWRHIAFA
jgi:hypothetical protein